jgi:predicted MFS family arabinose efflux permease
MFAAQGVTKGFIGPALGGALFAAAAFLPFWVIAAAFAVSICLLSLLPRVAARSSADERRLHSEIKEGIVFLWRHRLLRVVTILVATANFCNYMCLATLVLYVGGRAYGAILSAMAVGSVLVALLSRRIVGRLGGYRVACVTITVTPMTLIGIGLSDSNPWIIGTLLAALGSTLTLWNVASVSQRQRLTPGGMQGRASSAGMMLTWGVQPLGALAGGLVAASFGLAAPWIAAGALELVVGLALFRALRDWVD